MQDFYERFYRLAPASAAHHLLCERVYGADLDQHGFADVAQLDALTDALALRPGDHALEVGCGTGAAAERIARRTGALVLGVDLSEAAVQVARARVVGRGGAPDGAVAGFAGRSDTLDFAVADLNRLRPGPLGLVDGGLDAALAVDALYFADDLGAVVARLIGLVRPGGRLGLLHSYGWRPWAPDVDPASLEPGGTDLGRALEALDVTFRCVDLTAEAARLAARRIDVLDELRDALAADGLIEVWQMGVAEANDALTAVGLGLHRRYRYDVLVG